MEEKKRLSLTNDKVYAVLFLIGLFLHCEIYAQETAPPPKQSALKSLAATVGGDAMHVFSAPFRMTQQDGMTLFLFSAMTTGFVTWFDDEIDRNFIEEDQVYVKPGVGLAKVGEIYDSITGRYVLAGLSSSMLAGGVLFQDQKLLQTTRLMAESFLITTAITQLGKRIFGRSRPYTGGGPSRFDPFTFRSDHATRSFPSGHTSSAFSMMTVLAKQYDRWWVEIPAYTIAVSVALQRLESRNHWGADVFVGGAIGYWVGNTLVSRHKRLQRGPSVNPYIFGSRLGVVVSF